MSSFTTPLQLEFIDGRTWRVTAPFDYRLGALDSLESVRVPLGFITDFASIPRGLWNLMPPIGLYGKAAVIHDWLYQHQLVTIDPANCRLVNRGEADEILNEAMGVLCVHRVTRWLIFAGVRTGGWVSWNRYRKADADAAAGGD